MDAFGSIDVRPHELMLIVSKLGSGCGDDLGDARLTEILKAVRENPSVPLTLRCYVTSNYDYQNPGQGDDSLQDWLFYTRCDLRIIQRMGLVPGDTRPAREMFHRLLDSVETAKDILWFDEITSETWKGLPRQSCHYDKGRTLGLEAIIPPRSNNQMAQAKTESVNLMYKARQLQIRPHHLMCMTCFYGERDFAPIAEDNLFEAIDIIQTKPEIPIRLICGPCMICPPCPTYNPSSSRCVTGVGMALRDELKDLQVLQRLGLKYGDVLPARELYTSLFEKIHSTREICGWADGIARSPEWSVCTSPQGNPGYVKARAEGLGFVKPHQQKTQKNDEKNNNLTC